MSDSTKNVTVKSGISFSALFFLVLFILKVLGVSSVATWSWWWITAPLWGPLALVIAIVIIVFLFSALISLIE